MKKYLSLVKFSHTIFALPFALLGFFLAISVYSQSDFFTLFVLVIGCMITARNSAMGFNRLVDHRIDSQNERTAVREIPAGKVSTTEAGLFVFFNVMLFIVLTYFINPLCFYLSPIAIALILGYSYTKRFTWFCHVILGMGLALAPIGSYIAVSGSFALLPVLYGLSVMLWVAGFDVMYAMQDISFDDSLNLKSIPVRWGGKLAMNISIFLHVLSGLVMVTAGIVLQMQFPGLHVFHWIGVLIFCAFLIYQHTLVSSDDLSNINAAFFTSNGIASVVFGLLGIIDFLFYL